MIEAVEQEIIDEARKAVGTLVSVRPYPNNPSGYRPPHRRGEVLVRYKGSDYGTRASDGWAQDRNMKYELVLVFRDLRRPKGAQGAYGALEKLRQHFYDHRLSIANSYCQLDGDDFVGETNGIWQWQLTFSFDTVVTSARAEEAKSTLKEAIGYG